jgi:hypothetical protein
MFVGDTDVCISHSLEAVTTSESSVSTALRGALFQNAAVFILVTKRRGREVNIPASYSRGPGFKFRAGDQVSRLKFSWFFSVPLSIYWDST